MGDWQPAGLYGAWCGNMARPSDPAATHLTIDASNGTFWPATVDKLVADTSGNLTLVGTLTVSAGASIGAGTVTLDNSGVSIAIGSTQSGSNAYRFTTTPASGGVALYAWDDSASPYYRQMLLQSEKVGSGTVIEIRAKANPYQGRIFVGADATTSNISLLAEAVHAPNGIRDFNRSVAMGTWIDVPFNAANFQGYSGSVLTVSTAPGVNHYTLIGKTILWNLVVSGAMSGAAQPYLALTIPGGYQGAKANDGACAAYVIENGIPVTVRADLWFAAATQVLHTREAARLRKSGYLSVLQFEIL